MSGNNFQVDFIGIGARKSGTSWIFQCLIEHPNVCGPYIKDLYPKYKNNYRKERKEANFFSKFYDKGIDYYRSLFNHCRCDQFIGEFSPGYLQHEKCANRIHQHFPDVKLIACLRNPIDRLYSHYLYGMQRSFELDISKEFVAKNCEEIYSPENFKKYIFHQPQIVEEGFYYKQIGRYFKVFPPQNILIAIYEDIHANPVEFIQRIYKFLELDSQYIPPSVYTLVNPTMENTSRILIVDELLQKMKQLFKKIPYVNGRYKKVKKIIKNYNSIQRISKDNRPPMSAELQQYFQEVYREDIKQLEKLIGKDLGGWKQENFCGHG